VIKETMLPVTVETEQEDDGRWIAEVLELPGILVYAQPLKQLWLVRTPWPCR